MKSELLAPAGSIEALRAAVCAGADAVYFGGRLFNARAFAANFEGAELDEAFGLCRAYGVKVYITLNTLIFDREFETVFAFVDELEERYRPDAYIVQDIGLAAALRERYGSLPLHASTQMLVHNSFGTDMLKRRGFSRVVVAREASRENIAAIKGSGIETEIFVHGALCVSASGGCLFSAAIGGRSGNRGSCAQPCRQRYCGGYPLSLKDLCLAKHIPDILDLGIDCLKIEGRMKSPEYVYAVTGIYRRLIDERRSPTGAEVEALESAFARSGFTDGYYTGHIGRNMLGVRTDEDKEATRGAAISIEERRIPIELYCEVREGKPSYLRAEYARERDGESGKVIAEVFGAIPEKALSRPLEAKELIARLKKLGATPFKAEAKLDLDEGLNLPLSALNLLRREVCDELLRKIIEINTPVREGKISGLCSIIEGQRESIEFQRNKYRGEVSAVSRFEGRLPSKRALLAAFEVSRRVDIPIWRLSELPAGVDFSKVSAILPRTIFDSDRAEAERLIERAKDLGVSALTVPNISFLPLCGGFRLHGDYTLNITNSLSLKEIERLGFESAVLSLELNPKFIGAADISKEYIAYGRMPLMHTENCIISNAKGCGHEELCSALLTDKTGAAFAAIREYRHRNIIYNAFPTYLLDKREELTGFGVELFTLLFTDENDEEILSVLERFKNASPPEGKFTRAALKSIRKR